MRIKNWVALRLGAGCPTDRHRHGATYDATTQRSERAPVRSRQDLGQVQHGHARQQPGLDAGPRPSPSSLAASPTELDCSE